MTGMWKRTQAKVATAAIPAALRAKIKVRIIGKNAP